MIFNAHTVKGYKSIYKQVRNNEFYEWHTRQLWDEFDTASLLYSAVSDEKLIAIFNNKHQQQKFDLKRFLMLDLVRNEWRALSIPVIKTALPIVVSFKL